MTPIENIDLAELMDLLTVSASGRAEAQALAPAKITTISRDVIRRNGWRSLGEILAHVPGLYVVNDHVLPAVSVRGINGGLRAGTRIVKVLINGVPVAFEPDLTAFVGPEFLPIEAIETVEVAKGPLSAIYGANAFLATVSVITRTPEEGAHGSLHGRAGAIQGADGAWHGGNGASGLASWSSEHASLLAAVSADRTVRSGLRLARTYPAQDPSAPLYAGRFEGTSAGDLALPTTAYAALKVEAQPFGELVLQGGRQLLDSMGEFQVNSVLTDRSRYALENNWADLRHKRRWSPSFSTQADFGWSSGAPTRDFNLFVTGTAESSYQPRIGHTTWLGGVSGDWDPSERFHLRVGADALFSEQTVLHYQQTFHSVSGTHRPGDVVQLVSESDRLAVLESNIGVSLLAEGTPLARLPGLRFTGAFRLDLPNFFPPQYSFRASAAYVWSPSLVTKLFVGRAFQAPSMVLLFGLPGFGTSNNVIGALSTAGVTPRPLNPQSIRSAEFVLTASVGDHLLLEGSTYYQQVDDRIEFVQVATNFMARNQGTARGLGAELSAKLSHSRVEAQLGGTAHFQLVEDPDTGQIRFETRATAAYPTLLLEGSATLKVPEAFFDATVGLRWVGERGASQSNISRNNNAYYSLPSYASLDVAVTSRGLYLLSSGAETRLTLVLQNALDARSFEPGFAGFDLPSLGRTVRVELSQSF